MWSVAEPCKPPGPCRAAEVNKSEGNSAPQFSHEHKCETAQLSALDGQVHQQKNKFPFPFTKGIFFKKI